jgi:hypothetical protein
LDITFFHWGVYGVGDNVKGHWKTHIGWKNNIFYIIWKPRVDGKHGRKDIWGMLKMPPKKKKKKHCFWDNKGDPKRASWVLKILMFWVLKIVDNMDEKM